MTDLFYGSIVASLSKPLPALAFFKECVWAKEGRDRSPDQELEYQNRYRSEREANSWIMQEPIIVHFSAFLMAAIIASPFWI